MIQRIFDTNTVLETNKKRREKKFQQFSKNLNRAKRYYFKVCRTPFATSGK